MEKQSNSVLLCDYSTTCASLCHLSYVYIYVCQCAATCDTRLLLLLVALIICMHNTHCRTFKKPIRAMIELDE
jgi:hypothetical protein